MEVKEKKSRAKKTLEPGNHRAMTVAQQIEQMILSKASPIDIEELAIEVYNEMGGAKGLAKKLKADLDATTTGSPQRVRMLDIFFKLMQIGAPKEQVGETSQMTDADLERAAKALMVKCGVQGVAEQGWSIYDGTGAGI